MFVVNSCKKQWLEIDGSCFFLTPKKQVWDPPFNWSPKNYPLKHMGLRLGTAKEIKIILRLFLVMAMYCQASSS